MTGCNDRRHSTGSKDTGEVIVNMAVAISALDLYEKCFQQTIKDNITAENIPSISWYKFQFWPKDATAKNSYELYRSF